MYSSRHGVLSIDQSDLLFLGQLSLASVSSKVIANAPLCQDILWMARVSLELLAEVVNTEPEIGVSLLPGDTPDPLAEFVVRHHLSPMLLQAREKLLLRSAELDPLATHDDRA